MFSGEADLSGSVQPLSLELIQGMEFMPVEHGMKHNRHDLGEVARLLQLPAVNVLYPVRALTLLIGSIACFAGASPVTGIFVLPFAIWDVLVLIAQNSDAGGPLQPLRRPARVFAMAPGSQGVCARVCLLLGVVFIRFLGLPLLIILGSALGGNSSRNPIFFVLGFLAFIALYVVETLILIRMARLTLWVCVQENYIKRLPESEVPANVQQGKPGYFVPLLPALDEPALAAILDGEERGGIKRNADFSYRPIGKEDVINGVSLMKLQSNLCERFYRRRLMINGAVWVAYLLILLIVSGGNLPDAMWAMVLMTLIFLGVEFLAVFAEAYSTALMMRSLQVLMYMVLWITAIITGASKSPNAPFIGGLTAFLFGFLAMNISMSVALSVKSLYYMPAEMRLAAYRRRAAACFGGGAICARTHVFTKFWRIGDLRTEEEMMTHYREAEEHRAAAWVFAGSSSNQATGTTTTTAATVMKSTMVREEGPASASAASSRVGETRTGVGFMAGGAYAATMSSPSSTTADGGYAVSSADGGYAASSAGEPGYASSSGGYASSSSGYAASSGGYAASSARGAASASAFSSPSAGMMDVALSTSSASAMPAYASSSSSTAAAAAPPAYGGRPAGGAASPYASARALPTGTVAAPSRAPPPLPRKL
eukprot:PLAT7083.2.p1 GENE.PLAT7083.2~~PLAT7083.2.p1  ORF type:complete len:654 (-),score=191.32 PLAT7083.2:126-2087(-)